jgi:hypothetical protein
MTIFLDDNPLADDVPGADAAERRQPADVGAGNAELDTSYLANLLIRQRTWRCRAGSTPTGRGGGEGC